MRRTSVAALGLAVPALLALPVATRPVPRPRPVAPAVRELAVAGIDAAAARAARLPGFGVAGPARGRPLALTPATATRRFAMVGVTWAGGAAGEVDVAVRVRGRGGAWSGWHELHAEDDHAPDPGTPDAGARSRGGTAPLWVGDADGVQVRLAALSGAAPRDVRVSLVDPGTSGADAVAGRAGPRPPSSADAATGQPGMVSRAQWGADESLRGDDPSYAPTIVAGFVHHTDSSNTYAPAQAPAMIRGVYAFHVRSRGWSDIGYNFLVDKYGRVFEGRYGGVARPVIGAHTGGFNSRTFGVSLLGNYTSTVPSSAQLGALNRLLAWKLGLHHRDPGGTTLLTSAGSTRYAKGRVVGFPVVSGHRDGSLTACPGTQTYARLPWIRSATRALMGASLVDPAPSGTVRTHLDGGLAQVVSRALRPQQWALTATDTASGAHVRRIYGLTPVTTFAARWDLRDSNGNLVPPGVYRLRLDSWYGASSSVPYLTEVEVRSPLSSGLWVAGRDGVHRALAGRYAERPAPALRTALRGSAESLAANPYQLAPFAPAPVAIPDGGWFRTAGGAAYVVTGGVRRRVYAATAADLGWPASPPVLPDELWQPVPVGPPLTDASRHPDGTLVGDGTTTWRIESGVRRPLASAASVAAWSKGRVTAPALPGDLALPSGPALGPAEGTLLRLDDGGGAVVSGGALRRVSGLGYAVAVAPIATAADLAALPAGPDWSSAARHPSGALVRSGSAHWSIEGDARRPVHPALVAHDARPALPATAADLALPLASMAAPRGLAGVGADGVVRVAVDGRLVSLAPSVAASLGYGAGLPALDAVDFGLPVAAGSLVTTDRHPDGSLVTDGTTTWLVEAGARRALPAGVAATYRGRPVLPALAGDLALPASLPAPPASGSWLRTEDGRTWLVDTGFRRPVGATAARRLGLSAQPPGAVALAALGSGTWAGPPVP